MKIGVIEEKNALFLKKVGHYALRLEKKPYLCTRYHKVVLRSSSQERW